MSNKLIVYHGTNSLFETVMLNKSRNKRDFGIGFYTTTMKEQAEAWAENMFLRYGGSGKYVIRYEIEIDENLKIKQFEGLSEEWLEMVRENRVQGGLQHDYDIVIGPVADDNTMRTVALYVEGIYTAPMAIEQLKYFKANNQVSLHTDKAVSYLLEVERYGYE